MARPARCSCLASWPALLRRRCIRCDDLASYASALRSRWVAVFPGGPAPDAASARKWADDARRPLRVPGGGRGRRARRAGGGTARRDAACRARGLHADEAAAELLVRHGHWIGHAEFVARFAWVQACPEPGAVAVAGIDWQAAAGGLDGGGLAGSGSEAGLLRVAASLGGGVPVSPRAVLGRPDPGNIAPVARRAAPH